MLYPSYPRNLDSDAEDYVVKWFLLCVKGSVAFKIGRCADRHADALSSRRMYRGGRVRRLWLGPFEHASYFETLLVFDCRRGYRRGFDGLRDRCLNVRHGGGGPRGHDTAHYVYAVWWNELTPALEARLADVRRGEVRSGYATILRNTPGYRRRW